MNSSIFICQLSQVKQNKIKNLVSKHLIAEGFENDKIQEIIENVMSDRLVNIEEVVDINQFL
jgi:hypothetical protein